MARYQAQVVSSAALAANTNYLGLFGASGNGAKLRRCTLGTITNTATTPTSQQVQVGIFRATAAGTSSSTATKAQLDPNTAAANCTVPTAWSVQPTLSSAASYLISFNTQSAVDLPWELLEEWVIAAGTANGLVWQNMTNALPSGHQLVTSIEWEE
jgi:hypothetical protein